jgi:hypothetical protein
METYVKYQNIMKFTVLISLFVSLFLTGCEKQDIESNPKDLSKLKERNLYLKSGQQIYTDENKNEYLNISFDANNLSHVYGIYLEKDKKYNISVSGDNCFILDFNLLKSNRDTLFKGEDVMGIPQRKYITWTSDVSDTFFLSIKYDGDINFHTYDYRLTFEELTTKELSSNNIGFLCNGDWFINEKGYLTLICHQTGVTKWAKIQNDSIYHFTFSYNVSQVSGKPDNYVGIDCFASGRIFDMFNIPALGYLIDVIGPASWRLSYWNMISSGGVGFEYGNLSHNLPIGMGSITNISVVTFGDSMSFSVNNEMIKRCRNLNSLENGLYITVEDTKQDTIFFRDLKLVN